MLDEYRRGASPQQRSDSAPQPRDEPLFQGAGHLDRQALVRAVLERNPSIAAARAAWRAALARYPQVTAFDDPMLSYSFAPLSIGNPDVAFGQRIELSQKLPFPGKRGLRGDVALAEAEAVKGNVEATRLELARMASRLFDDYYVAGRALDINAQHLALVKSLKASAEAQYVAGRASQQDVLQAEVEITHLERGTIELGADRDLVVEQLNGLLHRAPELPLPPPPDELQPPERTETLAQLEKAALAGRPELLAELARIRSGEAAAELAEREYYPDITIMTSYSSMWKMYPHQWMVGLALNIPIQRGRRNAAVEEAQAKAARARSEYERKVDAIRVEVAQAARRVKKVREIIRLYKERLLPAARDQVEAARAGFIAGQNSFLAVIEAEKNLRAVELQLQVAQADLHRRLADLSRAAGIPLAPSGRGGAR